MNKNLLIEKIKELQIRKDLPDIIVGENVEVIMKSNERSDKEKIRFSSFKGTVIACRRKNQISRNFSVIREDNKLIVKKTFFFNSPLIKEIKKIGKNNKRPRRAKLFYLERKLSEKKDKS